MSKVQECKTWLRAHEDLFTDLVRIYLGCGLFVKACFFMTHRDYLHQMIGNSDVSWAGPAMMAHYIILAHLVGGALLALGIATRLAALVQLPVLFGAIFALYLPRYAVIEPRQYLEYAGLVAFLLVLFVVFGAGRFSIDYLMSRRTRDLGAAGNREPAVTT
jgi:putative oxidoreductase